MPPIFAPGEFFQGNIRVKNQRRRLLKSLAVSLFVPAAAWAQAPLPPLKLAMIEGLSGGNANGGEAVFRNLVWAVERVNDRGGVRLPGGARRLALERYDSKGQIEEALSALRSAIDDGAQFILQGNSNANRGAACCS